jgi:hypothetical protein
MEWPICLIYDVGIDSTLRYSEVMSTAFDSYNLSCVCSCRRSHTHSVALAIRSALMES